jgi:hypothetical protein
MKMTKASTIKQPPAAPLFSTHRRLPPSRPPRFSSRRDCSLKGIPSPPT